MATETIITAEERCQRDKETLIACCSSCKFVSGEEILNRMIGSGISQFTNLKDFLPLHSRPAVHLRCFVQCPLRCLLLVPFCKDYCTFLF